MQYDQRTYRAHTSTPGLETFTVSVKETDLLISASQQCEETATEAVREVRAILEKHIQDNPDFKTSLKPLPIAPHVPEVIGKMLAAGVAADVGPMAAVAGAVAEYVGIELLKTCNQVIIENGGDIFLKTDTPITIGVFAGESPLSEKIGMKISRTGRPLAVCTSSGRVGPSLSFGRADAATILSASATLADAVATSIGNLVHGKDDIQKAIDEAKAISGIEGILVIQDEHLGAWGDIELVAL